MDFRFCCILLYNKSKGERNSKEKKKKKGKQKMEEGINKIINYQLRVRKVKPLVRVKAKIDILL